MKRTFLTIYRFQFSILDMSKSPPAVFTHTSLGAAGDQVVRMIRNRLKDPFSTTRETKRLARLRDLLYAASQTPDHKNINHLIDCWNEHCAMSLAGRAKLALVRSQKFIERVELGQYVIRDEKGKFFETTEQRTTARELVAELEGKGVLINRAINGGKSK